MLHLILLFVPLSPLQSSKGQFPQLDVRSLRLHRSMFPGKYWTFHSDWISIVEILELRYFSFSAFNCSHTIVLSHITGCIISYHYYVGWEVWVVRTTHDCVHNTHRVFLSSSILRCDVSTGRKFNRPSGVKTDHCGPFWSLCCALPGHFTIHPHQHRLSSPAQLFTFSSFFKLFSALEKKNNEIVCGASVVWD